MTHFIDVFLGKFYPLPKDTKGNLFWGNKKKNNLPGKRVTKLMPLRMEPATPALNVKLRLRPPQYSILTNYPSFLGIIT